MNCSHCGYNGDLSAWRITCPVCGAVLSGNNSAVSATLYDNVIPWEAETWVDHPLKALCHTFSRSFGDRSRFFAATARATPLAPALLYGIVLGSIGVLASFFWEVATPLSIGSLLPGSSTFSGMAPSFSPMTLILTPFALLMQIGMLTLYCHGMLMITHGRRKNIAVTAKTVCYIQGAALFQIIPFAGTVLTFLAGGFLLLEGIHAAHGIGKTRVFLTLLLPLFLLVALIAAGTLLLLSVSALDLFSLVRR